MTRRKILTGTQLAELFDPPTDQRELVRHYTLSAGDLAMIQRCRGAPTASAMRLCFATCASRAGP